MWPISCVSVFCTSVATQLWLNMWFGHVGMSTVVNSKLFASVTALSSTSASRIRPDCGSYVVVVIAIAVELCCQQSYLLPQSSFIGSQHVSVVGTVAHVLKRN